MLSPEPTPTPSPTPPPPQPTPIPTPPVSPPAITPPPPVTPPGESPSTPKPDGNSSTDNNVGDRKALNSQVAGFLTLKCMGCHATQSPTLVDSSSNILNEERIINVLNGNGPQRMKNILGGIDISTEEKTMLKNWALPKILNF